MVDPASNLNGLTAHPLPHAHWQPRSRSRCDSGSQADRLSSSSLVTVDPAQIVIQISESGSDPGVTPRTQPGVATNFKVDPRLTSVGHAVTVPLALPGLLKCDPST
jgi:hypothetical protein